MAAIADEESITAPPPSATIKSHLCSLANAAPYYDREGMFPKIVRSNGGIRVFSDREIDTIRVIECLKSSGMSIKEIKEFLVWCQDGDKSLQKRRDMFHNRFNEVLKQIVALEKTANMLKYKCWYYDTAVAAGAEDAVKNLPADKIPKELRDYKI